MNVNRPRYLYKRTALFAVLALGPLGTACELFFDFDRTPLQPQYEAGADDDSGGGTPRRDATPDRGGNPGPPDSGSGDTGGTTGDADAQGG
jgi:hypothetical protein